MSTAIDNRNRISSNEATTIIENSVKHLLSNPELACVIPAIMLRGAPGVGKSTIVRSVADKLGIGFKDVRLAQMERVDFAGLPSVNNGTTEWNVPALWPRDPESKGILLLDEITSAPSDVQVAAYSLVLDRRIPNSNYELPKGWFIIAAGNRAIDKAVVKSMSSALANRFMHFEMEADAKDWFEWAVPHGVSPIVTAFINYKPSLLFKMKDENLEQGWPSPRSWERVSNMLSVFGGNETILGKVVKGLVGEGAATEFLAFHKLSAKLDDMREIMLDEKRTFTQPSKADERFAAVSAVIYHIWRGKDDAETEKLINGFYKVLNGLDNDFAALLVKGVMLGSDIIKPLQAMEKIIGNPNYKKAAEKFKADFDAQYNSL